RILDVVGRVEIRFAGAKADDVTAGILQLARLLRHRDRSGRLYARKGIGNEGHDWILRLSESRGRSSGPRGVYCRSGRISQGPLRIGSDSTVSRPLRAVLTSG